MSNTTATTPAMLPEIRIMSPLQILRPSQIDSSVTVSFHETFTTAFSSMPLASPVVSRFHSTTSPTSATNTTAGVAIPALLPPHSLRKSISVDSFIGSQSQRPLEAGPSSAIQQRARCRELGDVVDKDISDANIRALQPTVAKSFASRLFARTRGCSLIRPPDPHLDDSEHEHVSTLASQRPQGPSSLLSNGLLKPLILPLTRPSSSSTTKPNHKSAEPKKAFSIGVVGTSGCGKTTVIKLGLKVWGESISTISTSKGCIQYGVHTMNAWREDDTTALIIEVNSDNLIYDTPECAWPEGLPPINGVLVLYDASNLGSFLHVLELIAAYHSLQLPVIVVACKSDLECVIPPEASKRAEHHSIGLIEVTAASDDGRLKMWYCFKWLFCSIERAQRGEVPIGPGYTNPASPDVPSAPWSEGYNNGEARPSFTRSRIGTATNGSPSTLPKRLGTVQVDSSPTQFSSTPTPRPPAAASPSRVKSVSNLMTEAEKNRQEEKEQQQHDSRDGRLSSLSRKVVINGSKRSRSLSRNTTPGVIKSMSEEVAPAVYTNESSGRSTRNNSKPNGQINNKKVLPSTPWATVEELSNKLFFLAVSGDDPTFVKHFLLTYRKFSTPRTVLLGMQKCIRQLNKDHANLLFGNYAQMRRVRYLGILNRRLTVCRICDLLREWISTYPTDFATPGTHGALVALVKHISSNPCTLHYGPDILPFLDELPCLRDMDSSWALSYQDPSASDESDTLLEEVETISLSKNIPQKTFPSSALHSSGKDTLSIQRKPDSSTRKRKASLPLIMKSMTSPTGSDNRRLSSKTSSSPPSRNSLKDLIRLSQTLATYATEEIAQQITKMQADLFLAIEPRQWLRYTMSETRAQNDPISICANFYNHLAYWVSSLILAHDRVRARERQVERFANLAQRLRYLNNYVGLRAVMTGINNATYPNDEIMSLFRDTNIRLYQQYLGWGILLNSQHNHRAYRMALRNTDGPSIPDMEIHTFDMVRANDSNPNFKPDDLTKIHWGKFTLMARMILMLQGLQDKVRESRQFDFPERKGIREMIENEVMESETLQSRVFVPPEDAEPIFPLSQDPDSPSTFKSDSARFRKIFFKLTG